MPVWRTKPVEEQSTLTLERWRVLELADGDRHLVGHCTENCAGRVSSALQQFDPSAMRAVTCTGRVYTLRGPPSINLNAEYVWAKWADLYSVTAWTDVTRAVWAQHLEATDAPPTVSKQEAS